MQKKTIKIVIITVVSLIVAFFCITFVSYLVFRGTPLEYLEVKYFQENANATVEGFRQAYEMCGLSNNSLGSILKGYWNWLTVPYWTVW